MFKELGPLLRQRTVVLILTRLENDTIRVNVIPRKLNESENDALATPLSVAGTAEELDAELPSALVQFVGAHLELKNTLETEITLKPAEPKKSEPARSASLFDIRPAQAATSMPMSNGDEEEEILAEAEDDEPADELDDLDDAA
jgi:PRTRC genetic system protein E